MKTEKELNALKEEVKRLNEKLATLTDEELTQVTGGSSVLSEEMANQRHLDLPEEMAKRSYSGSILEAIGEWDIKAR